MLDAQHVSMALFLRLISGLEVRAGKSSDTGQQPDSSGSLEDLLANISLMP